MVWRRPYVGPIRAGSRRADLRRKVVLLSNYPEPGTQAYGAGAKPRTSAQLSVRHGAARQSDGLHGHLSRSRPGLEGADGALRRARATPLDRVFRT